MHGGWHHLVFWKTFRIQKKETDPCLIPGRKKAPNHPVFNDCFNDTLSGQISSGKKFQELHCIWTTGWLPMNCQKSLEKTYPFVAWFYYLNLIPYNLKSTTQQQIQMQTILTPNTFEVNTNQHYNCTPSGKIQSLNIHVPTNLPIGLLQKSCQQHCLFCNVANKGVSLETVEPSTWNLVPGI